MSSSVGVRRSSLFLGTAPVQEALSRLLLQGEGLDRGLADEVGEVGLVGVEQSDAEPAKGIGVVGAEVENRTSSLRSTCLNASTWVRR